MGRTLLDLFKNEPLARQGGKTAAERYEINDSKNIQWSSANPLVQNTGIALANEARKSLGNPTEETLVEQETTGLRVVRAGSIPVLYGNEVGRITLGTTSTKDRMIQATFGEESEADTGLLSGVTNSARKATDVLKTKLGFPNKAIPTYVAQQLNNGNFELGKTQDRDRQLFEIKNEAQGGILGNFLEGNGGTPTSILNNVIGSAITEVKDFARETVLGLPQESASPSGESGFYVNTNNYYRTDNQVHSFTRDSVDYFRVFGTGYGSIENPQGADQPEDIDKKGVKYSDSTNINPVGDEGERKDLASKQQLSDFNTDYQDIRYSRNVAQRKPKFDPTIIGKTRDVEKNIERDGDYGIKSYSDLINASPVLSEEQENFYEDNDFITLKFKSIPTKRVSYFRATISGLNETFSPEWESGKFIGSPFSFHTYSGISREVSFGFKVFPLNALEHKRNWERLDFLTSLVYPQGYYEGSTAVKPPLIEFTLGNMYKNKTAFISSLSYTIDDNSPWNITNDENYVNEVNPNGEKVVNTISTKNYKLPMIIDVEIGVSIIESRRLTENNSFYSFNPQES